MDVHRPARSRRRIAVVALTAAATLLATAAPALADIGHGSDGYGNCSAGVCHAGVSVPLPVTTITHAGGTDGDSSSTTVSVPCFFVPAPVPSPDPHAADESKGGWYYAGCGTDNVALFKDLQALAGVPIVGGIGTLLLAAEFEGFYFDDQPPRFTVDTAALTEIAKAQVKLPTPTLHINPDGGQGTVVGLYTWAWATLPVQTVSASATELGVTSTVTAKVAGITVDFGPGGSVDCTGLGTPYTGTGADGPSPSGCDLRFVHPSAGQPGGAYPGTVTVHWTVGGNYLTGGDVQQTVSQTVPVKVGEIESLVTAGS